MEKNHYNILTVHLVNMPMSIQQQCIPKRFFKKQRHWLNSTVFTVLPPLEPCGHPSHISYFMVDKTDLTVQINKLYHHL